MRHKVSPAVMKNVISLFKEGKKVPLIKIKLDKRLRKGDVIMLRSVYSPSQSIKVKVAEIKEYVTNTSPLEELKTVYTESKLKAIFRNNKIKKFYIIYVEPVKDGN